VHDADKHAKRDDQHANFFFTHSRFGPLKSIRDKCLFTSNLYDVTLAGHCHRSCQPIRQLLPHGKPYVRQTSPNARFLAVQADTITS
jgi:hypothetical protein